MINQPSPNFAFLAHHDPRLVALGTQAEEQFANGDATRSSTPSWPRRWRGSGSGWGAPTQASLEVLPGELADGVWTDAG